MSRQVDLSKPLSDEDKQYLEQLGQGHLIQRAEGGGEDSSATAGPQQITGEGLSIEDVPNTGDVNTLDRGDGGGAGGTDLTDASLETVVTDKSYGDLTVAKLQAELERRDLPTSGKKDELVARLEANDAETAAAAQQAGDALDEDEDDDEDDGQ